MASRSTPAPRRSGAFARPAVWLALLLLVAAGGYFAFHWWQQRQTAADERARLLADVAKAVAAAPPDRDELSRLMAGLQKLPDRDTARDLQAAEARIELARERPERAYAAFASLARQPGASPVDQGLGARILLAWDQSGASDLATARGTLLEAATMAASAFAASGDVADLQCAWLAALRAPDANAAKGYAQQMTQQFGATPAGRLVAASDAFPNVDRGTLAKLLDELSPPPVELAAMDVLLVLQGGDVKAAVAAADRLLVTAPGVIAARWSTVAVFHACAFAAAADSPDRAEWLARRDGQLDWLLQRAPADDPRRARWVELRAQR